MFSNSLLLSLFREDLLVPPSLDQPLDDKELLDLSRKYHFCSEFEMNTDVSNTYPTY